jgi:hypothetical protein
VAIILGMQFEKLCATVLSAEKFMFSSAYSGPINPSAIVAHDHPRFGIRFLLVLAEGVPLKFVYPNYSKDDPSFEGVHPTCVIFASLDDKFELVSWDPSNKNSF